MAALLPSVRPSYAVLPGWSYNDRSGPVHADQSAISRFTARLIQSGELCRDHGVEPIFLTPLPRNADAMSQIQLGPWLNLRQTLLKMKSAGAFVLDVTALLGHAVDGELDGTYMAEMTDDGAHPNDAGHGEIATHLINMLRAACG
jgi:hypothetical protein